MYAKLFSSILDSSVWLEPEPTRIVWLTLLAAKDQDGFARFATVENLAKRANVSLEHCVTAVRTLEAPDPNSSNPDHEGRRIERVPGGWMVLNAVLYDSLAKTAHRREQVREAVARHRQRQRGADEGDGPAPSPAVVPPKPPTPVVNSHPPKKAAELPPYDPVFEEAWAAYPPRPNNTKAAAWRQWLLRIGERVDPADMLAGTKRYAEYVTRESVEPRYIKLGATFYGRDRHFLSDYTVSATPSTRTQKGLRALENLDNQANA